MGGRKLQLQHNLLMKTILLLGQLVFDLVRKRGASSKLFWKLRTAQKAILPKLESTNQAEQINKVIV